MFSRVDRDEAVSFSYWISVAWPWALVAFAWGILFFASSTQGIVWLDHDYLLNSGRLSWPVALGLFLASWQLMIAAMMLPSIFPQLSMLALAGPSLRWLRQPLFLVAYGLVWTLFALLAFLGDTLLHQLVRGWLWLYQHSWLIGAVMFILAGVVQFSPFKRACLRRCCDLAGLCVQQERGSLLATWRLGWRSGWFCLGSCWALMLVMFAVGGRGLLWMALLALAMLLEKLDLGGQNVRVSIGVGFLLLALFWLIFFVSHLA